MKILLVTEFFPQGKDLKFSGGVEARTYFLAKYLAKKHDVHIICTRQENSSALERLSGIRVHRVGPPLKYSETGSIFETPSKLLFILAAIKESAYLKPDIVDGSNFIAHLISKQISDQKKIPAVFWYPDVFIGKWLETSGIISGSAGWLLEKFNFLRGADHFIAISASTANKLKNQNVDLKKISQIPCGVSLSEFKVKTNKNANKIICISRLVSYKRIKDLVLAFAFLLRRQPTLQLTIIGSGPEKNKLMPLIKDLKIETKIRFLQNLPRERLVKELKSSYLFCLPSAVEGFGIATIEAAAAGIPYVVSDIPVLREVTNGGRGGLLFEPGNPNDLAQKIEKLFVSKKLYKQKARQALDLAQNYSWQEISRQTEKLYKNLLR